METGSTKVLKSHATRELGERVVFNLEDVHQKCQQYIEEVRTQAREIITEAQAEADELREQTRKAAREEGRREGLSVAHEELNRRVIQLADERVSQQVQQILPVIQQAAEMLTREREAWLQHWESATLSLAISIAEKIIRSELTSRPEIVQDTLRATLELVTGASSIEVQLHPDDVRLLGENRDVLLRELSGCGEVTLIENPQITPGGCLVKTQHGTVDAQLETQLERIASEIG